MEPLIRFQTIKQFKDMFEDSKIWVPDAFVVGSSGSFVQEGPARSFLRVLADGSVKSSFRLGQIDFYSMDLT